MEIKCEIIILDPPEEGVYRSGQPVSGILRYALEERTQFDAVVLHFKGKGKCTWRNGGKYAPYHRGKVVYVSLQECLLINKEINEGVYDHRFNYVLPNDIPSSFKDSVCTISYKIVAEFSRPGLFTRTKKFDKEITVYGYLESRLKEPTIFGLTKTPLFYANRIDMKIEIEKTFVMPGENINLKYVITNGTNLPVTGVKMKLKKEKIYIADDGFKYTDRKDVKKCAVMSTGAKETSVASSHCILPTLPNLYSIHSKVFIREYKLHVTAKLPFPHINASVEIPVVIGEKVNSEQSCALDSGFVLYPDLK